ncbi:MAG: biopolymer transporter ExbD [Veillonellaceae bacterium]|uniref:ExbD/TolR family protein n=1 Tax=uncultured Selenomonas sp. TaxID=159275 RepID=UPI0015672E3A|nr:biopolymer transporter ExbD [uncultured Selenomonas sp.]MCI6100942.1 biopolymer transporter ExbD [Selenomonas sp.]MCI7539825.1 biopolymer transporter ExbD [Veillonellaceae bacterium]MDD6698499.1 biopolymer transporter ExbD [Veillonellaceae bacterium]
MRLRDRRAWQKPEVIIIPMIDIMFFLLVFFMMSTLYMVQVKTVDVDMPQAASAETQLAVSYVVTMKRDGSLYLEDQPVTEAALLDRAAAENQRSAKFSVVVRADQGLDYGMVVGLLDKFKARGITHIGLAAADGGR